MHEGDMATAPKSKPKARKSDRPPHLAQGRWLGDFPNLSPAEKRLVECCAQGEIWVPEGWDWENPVRPEKATKANTIRAGLIRFLLLSGDALHPVHEQGVMVWGAWIEEELDFSQCRAAVRLSATHCHFDTEPVFTAAHLPELSLIGSRVLGIRADRIKVAGSLFLRDGFAADGAVRLLGAEIGGNLDCSDGTFSAVSGNALDADRISVKGNVFLNHGFTANGAVWLVGAEIQGMLSCVDGKLINVQKNALQADGLILTGSLMLRDSKITGAVVLAGARIGSLVDDAECWQFGGHIFDGFYYGQIVGPTDAAGRIAWLNHQWADHLNGATWKPQPWEQLIKVFRDMGHPGEAAEVAIDKQRMMRRAGVFKGPVRSGLHWLYGLIAGYGYRPARILLWIFGLWLASSLWFSYAANTGLMAPTSAEIIMHRQVHADFGKAGVHAGDCGLRGEVKVAAQYWPACTALPSEYTTFNPLIYSADLILPLVDLQQDSEWAPAATYTDAGGTMHNLPAGQFTRALMWFEILFGWFASLMFVAIVSRLVEKD